MIIQNVKWFLPLLCLLLILGCSPNEKSIEKAVARGDYEYIEKYLDNPKDWNLDNPKYWNDAGEMATRAVAVEGLILLNRIDKAIVFYNEKKGKPVTEEMIVKAFVNALAKNKPQKMPEKLIELINDDENGHSDALLRKTTVEIEPAIGVSKIKHYVEKAINDRQTFTNRDYGAGELSFSVDQQKWIVGDDLDFQTPKAKERLSKALLWDVKGVFAELLNLAMQQYSKLETINNLLISTRNDLATKEQDINQRKKDMGDYKQSVESASKNIEDLRYGNPYNLVVNVCLQSGQISAFATSGRETPYSYCLKSLQEVLERDTESLKEKRRELEKAMAEAKKLEKAIAEYESQQKAKLPGIEEAETQLLKSLNSTNNISTDSKTSKQ